MISRLLNREATTICIAVFGCVGLILLQAQFWDFVLDDAYIFYRYSKHLSEGAGLLWNLGEDPVEGYTSFLWVLIHAGAIKLNWNPAVFSKILSCIVTLSIVLILSIKTRKTYWPFSVIIVAGIAFNPCFALLSMMGMETIITSFLALFLCIISMRLVFQWSTFNAMLLHGLAILSMLSRPDMAPFVLGVFIGITGIYIFDRKYKELRFFFLTATVPLLIGLGYMYWRFQYFGYLFPNTFYRKALQAGTGLPVYLKTYFPDSAFPGLSYVISFIKDFALPYIFLAIIAFFIFRDSEKFRKILPSFLGSLGFLFFLLFVIPVQGFFWRFAMPILPACLYSLATIMQNNTIGSSKGPIKTIFSVFLALLFILWPLRLNEQTRFLSKYFTLKDRILVGKALSDLPGTMFVSDSGALPYFSGWRAVDHFGLNSETIAHKGLTVDFLQSLNPDLIMLSMRKEKDRWDDYPIVKKYIQKEDFAVGAVILKNPTRIHLYLIRKNSAQFTAITDRFRKLKDVTLIDPLNIDGDDFFI